jgi:3-hydroxy acid dehydrogenase / malonic semialdehyde reductase
MASKVIVITGASAGIGAETARVFAERGWHVVAGARRLDKLKDLASSWAGGKNSTVAALDVTDDKSVKAFTQTAHSAAHGKIDVLFNNAGLALGVDHLATGAMDDWQAMLDTNVSGLLRVTRAFLPGMLAAGHGHIINMGSIAGHLVYDGGGVYCATKHAVGMVETDFSLVRFKDDATRAGKVYHGVTPLTGEDIAECVWFAASRPAHVNIEEIVVMPVDQAAPHKINRRP